MADKTDYCGIVVMGTGEPLALGRDITKAGDVFVVIRSDGEYSGRYETVIGYFTDETGAQTFCSQAEREWKDAATLYPEPKEPRMSLSDDYDLHPPSYRQKVMTSPEEKVKRAAVRLEWRQALDSCRANRQSAVTVDKDGRPESSWYYETASPLGATVAAVPRLFARIEADAKDEADLVHDIRRAQQVANDLATEDEELLATVAELKAEVARKGAALKKSQEALVFTRNWMRTECVRTADYSLIHADVEGALVTVTDALKPTIHERTGG